MKKLYSLLALAVVAISASATLPVVKATADVSKFQKVQTNTEISTFSPRMKVADAKLQASATNESHSRMKAAPAGEWNNIGKCTWFEGLFPVYGFSSGLFWEVDIEESATTPGYYRILPYSVDCEISQIMEETDTENYIYVNATDPDKVYIDGDFTPYGSTLFSHITPENEWQESHYGKLADKIITFEANSFATYYNGWYYCNTDGEFAIALPGADIKYYQIKAVATSLCDNPALYFTQVGADVASVKIVCLKGYYTGSDEIFTNVNTYGQEFELTTGEGVSFEFEERDIYTVFAVSVDAAGNVQKGISVYFVGTADTDTWTSAGTATYNEVLMAADWGAEEEEITVDVEESTSTPGLYRLVNPYAKHSQFGAYALSHDHNHYLYVNASNPDKVYVESSVLGLGFQNYGEVYLWSMGHNIASAISAGDVEEDEQYDIYFGTKTDNVITMPAQTLLLGYTFDNNGAPYLIGNEGTFKITLSSDSNGIESVSVADENAPVEYFNLQGVRVTNPENGLFIRRQGNTVSKVTVK